MTAKNINHFLSSELCNGDPKSSRFHIIPAPLEKSVSYGIGTSLGPSAILAAYEQLELLSSESYPHHSGIHTQDPVDPDLRTPDFLLELENRALFALKQGAVPITLGGEHTVSFAPISACVKEYGEPIGVIQFDAHADLRRNFQGSPYSHASVMLRAVEELNVSLFQIAVRAFCEEEKNFRLLHQVGALDAPVLHKELRTLGKVDILPRIEQAFPSGFPKKIYISFDVDGFDASFMPATGTPVPGGLFWPETISILQELASVFTIVGLDVVELAPISYLPYCNFAAAQLVYDIMGFISSRNSL
ncbi:MAG: agmatinase family protein [Spirochaetales bacterium]|jgi:agmatinase|nr:agmatinase family protein [Spirochaetales bacterium]